MTNLEVKTPMPSATPKIAEQGSYSVRRLVRPRRGQAWAFGSTSGRRDTIKCVYRGLAGRWKVADNKLAPEGKQTAMYVQWESRLATIGVQHIWRNWVHVA